MPHFCVPLSLAVTVCLIENVAVLTYDDDDDDDDLWTVFGVFCFYFSCSQDHVRDILRKSYGDEALGSLGPNTVLSVPDGT